MLSFKRFKFSLDRLIFNDLSFNSDTKSKSGYEEEVITLVSYATFQVGDREWSRLLSRILSLAKRDTHDGDLADWYRHTRSEGNDNPCLSGRRSPHHTSTEMAPMS
jgi:hypothetical protein